ncbi:MAG: hypothetical protein KF817_11005 [Phycisphaeraceae bacterium]|nr:hypothetical protein [Phycisphaeraceae bacterium]
MTTTPEQDDRGDGLAGTITGLLNDVRHGRAGAEDELFATVYGQLRRLAGCNGLQRNRCGDLEGTALVNAACERLLGRSLMEIENRRHFYFVFTRAMRDVLVEHERRRAAQKRGGDRGFVPLTEFITDDGRMRVDLLDLDAALERLEAADHESAFVVMLRFFAGQSLESIASLTGASLHEVRSHWRYARAFLHDLLSEGRRDSTAPPAPGSPAPGQADGSDVPR